MDDSAGCAPDMNNPIMSTIRAATATWPRFMRDEIVEAAVLTAVVARRLKALWMKEPRYQPSMYL